VGLRRCQARASSSGVACVVSGQLFLCSTCFGAKGIRCVLQNKPVIALLLRVPACAGKLAQQPGRGWHTPSRVIHLRVAPLWQLLHLQACRSVCSLRVCLCLSHTCHLADAACSLTPSLRIAQSVRIAPSETMVCCHTLFQCALCFDPGFLHTPGASGPEASPSRDTCLVVVVYGHTWLYTHLAIVS
jgi:hypothetical protein